MDNHSLINTTRAKSNWKFIVSGKTDDDNNGTTNFTNNYPSSTDPSIRGCLINVKHLFFNPTETNGLNVSAVKIYLDGVGVSNVVTNEDLTNGNIDPVSNEPASEKYRQLNPSTCIGIFPLSHRGVGREGTQIQSRAGNPYTSGIWCSADIPSLTAFTVRIKPWTYAIEDGDDALREYSPPEVAPVVGGTEISPAIHQLEVGGHPYTPVLNGTYISVGSYYRDPSPPRNFKASVDHHLFRRDDPDADHTYLLFSYGIHTTATWYVAEYPLLGDEPIDYLNNNSTTLGQLNQHSIGTGWNDYSDGGAGGGIGHYPSAAYTPSHTLTATYTAPVLAPVLPVDAPVADWSIADEWGNRQFGFELEVIQIRNEVKI